MGKAIVFDLNETLIIEDVYIDSTNAMFQPKTKNLLSKLDSVMKRPGLEKLLKKLAKVRKCGVEIIIFTSTSKQSVENNFLNELPEKYKKVFTKIITKEDYLKPKQATSENYLKPKSDTSKNYLDRQGDNNVTTLEHDEILLFDANKAECEFLSKLYDKKQDCEYPEPDKRVTLVRLPFQAKTEAEMYALKETAKDFKERNKKFTKKVKEYFFKVSKEPGCRIMIDKIDNFVKIGNKKKFDYFDGTEKFNEYNAQLKDCWKDIEDMLEKDQNILDIYREYLDKYYEDKYPKNTYPEANER